MGKIQQQNIDNFQLGKSNDLRSKDSRRFAMARHFDVFTYPHKLVPRFGADAKESGDDFAGASTKPFKFFYDTGISSAKYLFGLCRTSNNYFLILYWDNDAGQWVAPANGLSTSGVICQDVFFSYKGYAYVWADGDTLQRYKLDGTTAFDDDYQTVTAFTTSSVLGASQVCQPVHHSKDDIAYFFSGNLIHTLNGSDTWGDSAFTLPTGSYAVAACEYQDYLVVAVNYTGFSKTEIFFWNRDTSQTTASYKYVLDNKIIRQLNVVNGRLMAISTDYVKVFAERYNGAEFQTVGELISARTNALATNTDIDISKEGIVVDNKLYFPMDFIAEGAAYNSRLGIWAVDANGKFSLDYKVNAATVYKGLFYLQGNFWISYNTGSVVRSSITFSTSVTSDYETLFLGDARQTKKLKSVGVETEPMPTAGQITLKYRVKVTDDWTTIFTHTTDASRYHEAINIESTGATLPQYEEIQFKVESIGGAVLTGLTYKYEEIDNRLN